METNNWRLVQGGESLMDTGDWRSQLQADSRQAIVNKIMETLKRHIPVPGQELKEMAVRFEEKIFTTATSQSEYLRKISLKMLAMETKSQNPISFSLQPNSSSTGQNQRDLGPTNQSQAGQQQDAPEQQQQLSQNPQQYLYQQHLQNQLMKQKFKQGNISHSQTESHTQQQQQENLIQRNQLQSSQQSVPQPSMAQSSQLSTLQQKQLFQSQSALQKASSNVMDSSNWRPTQGGEPSMDNSDWRCQLQADSRQRIVTKITDTLKRHLPYSGQEGPKELEKIAVRFEEKTYTAATSQSDYLRKISLKMLTMEIKNPMPISLQSNFLADGLNLPDPVVSLNQLVADLQCKLVNWIDNLGCER